MSSSFYPFAGSLIKGILAASILAIYLGHDDQEKRDLENGWNTGRNGPSANCFRAIQSCEVYVTSYIWIFQKFRVVGLRTPSP
jgi:hypothetical protein